MAGAEKAAMMKGLGKNKGKGHARVHEVHVRRASGGGYIAKHDMADEAGNHMGTEEHVIPDAAALQDHMQGAMGDQPPAGQGAAPPMGGGGDAPIQEAE